MRASRLRGECTRIVEQLFTDNFRECDDDSRAHFHRC